VIRGHVTSQGSRQLQALIEAVRTGPGNTRCWTFSFRAYVPPS